MPNAIQLTVSLRTSAHTGVAIRKTQLGENGFPRQWCSAQRIYYGMIAGGNHTIVY